jgi:S-formylglutathione hydrolase FrmB
MSRGVVRAVATLLTAALLGACSAGGSGDDDPAADEAVASGGDVAAEAGAERPEPELFEGGDFYDVPDPLPAGEHGDLIRYEPIETAEAGLERYRVMYLSESLPGDPIAVTGTVAVPTDPAPGGGRDVLTVAHGTTGVADECAPSRSEDGGDRLAPLLAGSGYVVANTDYEGLGTPGRHPYLVGASEGRGVLDAARAAAQVPGADVSGRVAIAGYSQGGHGALWAGELAEAWTPELDVVGTFAGAPPSETGTIFTVARSLPLGGFLYMIIAGYEAAYPDEADPALLLTPAGVDALGAVDEGCTGQVMASVGAQPAADLVKPDTGTVEPWATLADENDPGQVRSSSPVLIIHSLQDDIVPATFSAAIFERLCAQGQDVERRTYDEGQGHGDAAGPAFVDGLAWIADRFAGEPTTPNCP